jgi:hypothetical protein
MDSTNASTINSSSSTNGVNNNNNTNNNSKDLNSIMTQVENLQRQLASQAAELKDTRDREEAARKQVDQLNEVNSKLTEAKREAMKQDFNNVVQGWVRSLDSKQVPDTLKEEFLNGVEKFVDKGNESGIWKVRRGRER